MSLHGNQEGKCAAQLPTTQVLHACSVHLVTCVCRLGTVCVLTCVECVLACMTVTDHGWGVDADTWYTNGTVLVPNTGLEGAISGTYQPVWDSWQRFIQPLVSNVSCVCCHVAIPVQS